MRNGDAGRALGGRGLALAVGLAACGLLWAAAPAGAREAGTVTRFTAQGCTAWTVPAGVTSVRASAIGAAGGGSSMDRDLGGRGDGFAATLSGLAGGENLDVCVDYGGGSATTNGLGGGASGVGLGSTFAAPILVAAGGGGAGYDAGGGNAGYPAGAAGGDVSSNATGGEGGTQTAGGAAGSTYPGPSTRAAGARFDARGPGVGGTGDYRAGAGGAGYFGGGGGAVSAGGGGGSDFCSSAPTVSGCTRVAGAGTSTGAGPDPGEAQVSLSYTVPGAPSVHIATPGAGASYQQGQVMATSFACTEGHDGPGIARCHDAAGRPSGSALDTATLGTHTFTATAVSRDGLTTTSAPVTYTVVTAVPPTSPLSPPAAPPGPPATSAPKPTGTALRLRVTRFRQSHTRWRERGEHVAKRLRKRPVGTTFSFRLNHKAKVTLTFTARKSGRKVKHHCVPKSAKNKRARHCTRTVTAGRVHHTGHAGRTTIRFAGKLPHHHKLRPGTYHVRLTARSGKHTARSRRRKLVVL